MPADSEIVDVVLPANQPYGAEWAELAELAWNERLGHAHIAFCGIHQRDYVEFWAVDRDSAHPDTCPVAPGTSTYEHWLKAGGCKHIRPICLWVILRGDPDLSAEFHQAGSRGV